VGPHEPILKPRPSTGSKSTATFNRLIYSAGRHSCTESPGVSLRLARREYRILPSEKSKGRDKAQARTQCGEFP
jgi:hypothetical protein